MSQSSDPPLSDSSDQLYTREFFLVLAVQMCFGISFAAFLMLPKFLRVELGATASEIGWMAGTSLVASAVFSPFVGLLTRFVARKKLLAASILMEGGGALLFSQVTEIGAFAYSIRIVQGLAFVIVFNCTTTLVADIAPKQHLARAIGYVGLAMLLTNALAPLLTEPLADSFGWDTAFSVSGIAALSALVCLPFLPKQKKRPKDVRTHAATRPASLGPVYYASLVTGVGLGVMFTFVQPYALSLGAKQVGQFFIGYVIAAGSSRTVFAGLADRVGRMKTAICALSLYALVTAVSAGLTPSLLIPLGAGLGLAHGFLYPSLSALGIARTLPEQRSMFMGWFFCAFNVGFAISVLGLGPVADEKGYALVFLVAGGCVATGVVGLLTSNLRQREGAAEATP